MKTIKTIITCDRCGEDATEESIGKTEVQHNVDLCSICIVELREKGYGGQKWLNIMKNK